MGKWRPLWVWKNTKHFTVWASQPAWHNNTDLTNILNLGQGYLFIQILEGRGSVQKHIFPFGDTGGTIFWSSSCHLVTVVLKLTVRWYWDNSSWESNSTNGCNISQVTITLAELRTVLDLDMSTLQINNVWAADIIDLSQGSDIYHFW